MSLWQKINCVSPCSVYDLPNCTKQQQGINLRGMAVVVQSLTIHIKYKSAIKGALIAGWLTDLSTLAHVSFNSPI